MIHRLIAWCPLNPETPLVDERSFLRQDRSPTPTRFRGKDSLPGVHENCIFSTFFSQERAIDTLHLLLLVNF
jgi:hypothetical protein